MKTAILFVITFVITLCASATAYADFSYTTTRKAQGPPAPVAPSSIKHSFKGQKMMTESGGNATIIDFDAQTITTVSKTQKTYSEMKFSELGQVVKSPGIETRIDVKETGQKKVINGFNASETVLTMQMDSPQMSRAGMKMQMEIDMWLSSEVPGVKELKAFYQKNGANFPWAALSGGAGAGMQTAMNDMQRKAAADGSVPLLQIVKTRSTGGPAQTAQMQQGMAQSRAQMEALIKEGGPRAEAAKQALARMGNAATGAGPLFETTMESGNFSTASIPDSAFAIPAGFQKSERK